MASQAIAFLPESSLTANLLVVTTIHAIAMAPVSAMRGTLALTLISSQSVAMAPKSAMRGSMAMVLASSQAVAFKPKSAIRGALALVVVNSRTISFSPTSALKGKLFVGLYKSQSIGFSPTSSLKGTLSLAGMTASLTLSQVLNEVLNLWGIEGTCNAPDFAIARAIGDINSAMQTVWNQADERDYWTSETLTLTFAAGISSQDLPDDIQNVVGPCRRADNKRPLAVIGSVGELETFSDIYLDGQTADQPVAYHIDRMNQTGDDPVKTSLKITPAVVGASVSFLLDVVREAPRYMVGDIGLNLSIPIPHRYAESLLLPIVRYRASSFWLFNNTESKATIDRDYQMAMSAIGMADPNPGKTLEKEGATSK